MILDPSIYEINKQVINDWVSRKVAEGGFDYSRETGSIALATGVPIIIVDYFAGELLNWPTEIKAKIASDMKFYHVTEVIGYTP